MLFSTHSHTSHLLHCCFHSVLRLGDCLLCHGSGEVFVVPLVLNSLTMCAAVSEEAASDILVGAQPRIRCWTRARSSSSELVDTATARRRQREEDATRVGLQFPFRSERRGRGAPSIATKWRDAVKAAIMHGPLPPDVTLEAPHWWQPGMPLLPPADYVAPVPLKRKRDTSAEPKTDPTKRAYTRTPDEAKLWFQDFHAYQARVHGKSLAYNIRRAKQLVPELFGPVAPDTFRRWHDSGAPDHRGRPPVDLPPFALSRLANLTHAVAARLSLSVSTWQHVYRRVLRELDIEFEPSSQWTRKFLRSLQLSWKLAATCTRNRPSEADIARERKLLQLRVIYLCDRYKISQDRIWNLDETAVRIIPAGERGWSKRAEAAHVFASRAFVTVTLAANMRGGMWTQIVYEGKSGRVHPHGPAFPRQLVSHSPTHWITQEALLDMIDAIDADMHARPGDAELTPWLLVLDCAPQHIAAEFRSIMRDTRPHIKLCYVQRNFTGYTQPLDRAYMRAFKSSIRQEVAKHFAEFFLEVESNFERVNLDSSTAVLRQLLLSLVHTAAQDADSPQHRTAGWRFIDWNEVEQRELLAEAKRLLETGELFPRGTAEEPHAPDAEAEASDSEPEAHVVEPLADDHSSDDGEDAPTGVEESAAPAAPAAPAVAAAPKRAAMSLLERLQAIRIIYGSTPAIMTASLPLCRSQNERCGAQSGTRRARV